MAGTARRLAVDVRFITLSPAPLLPCSSDSEELTQERHSGTDTETGTETGKWLEEAVGRILYPEGRRPFIWAARYHTARAANPGTSPTQGGMRGQTTLGPPIRPCSAWGLPCPLRFRRGGALLPHPFTLTPGPNGGGLLSAALSLALPRPGVTRHAACRGVRTFLQDRGPSGRPPPPAAPSIPPVGDIDRYRPPTGRISDFGFRISNFGFAAHRPPSPSASP